MSYQTWGKENALREQIVRVGRMMYDRGLVVGVDGNISARLSDSRVLVTPTGVCKGLMSPEQLIIVDMEGRKVGPETQATRDMRPTSETRMHLEAYRQRPEVGGVVHAHPATTIALSIAGVSLADCMIPEVIVNLGLVPTTDYATPASDENVYAIRDLIGQHDAIILRRHGSITVGADPWQAFVRLEFLEQLARITLILKQLDAINPIPPEEVQKLLVQRQKAGLARPGELTEFSELCGVCCIPSDSQAASQPSAFQAAASQAAAPSTGDDAQLIATITRAVLKELGQAK